jgi:cell division septal protein FtsQ
MLYKKNKNIKSRRPSHLNTGSDFRRNSVVVSKKQREVADHKQSVSQRQIDSKKRRRAQLVKRRIITASLLALAVFLVLRFQITGFAVRPEPGIVLTNETKVGYEETMINYAATHSPLKQIWLLDKVALTSFTINKHPEISKIDLSASQPLSTEVDSKLFFRKPIFIWEGVGETYFIDEEGVLFSKNMFKEQKLDSLPKIEDQGGVAPDPGQTVLTETIVSDIAQIYSLLPKLYPENKVNKIILPPAAREIKARLNGVPYVIKFSTERSIGEQVDELQQLLAFLKSSNVTPGAHIDLRIPSKSFYK